MLNLSKYVVPPEKAYRMPLVDTDLCKYGSFKSCLCICPHIDVYVDICAVGKMGVVKKCFMTLVRHLVPNV